MVETCLVRDWEPEAAGEPFAIELVSESLPISTGREDIAGGLQIGTFTRYPLADKNVVRSCCEAQQLL